MTELIGGQITESGTSAAAVAEPAGTVEVVLVRALLLGERLDTRALERDQPLGVAPLTVKFPGAAAPVRLWRDGPIWPADPALDNFGAWVETLRDRLTG